MGMSEVQIPSPTPAFTQPQSTAGLFFGTSLVTAPMASLPLPSMFAPQQCGVSMGMGSGMAAGMGGMGSMGGMGGMGGFGWDRYQEYATIM